MAETTGSPDAMRFEHKELDVSCCIEQLFCGGTKLIMGEEEVELKKKSCAGICNSTKRGPYGEMGTVDGGNCLCFKGFSASSLMPDGDMQCIGCGCEGEKVDEIVAELKNRQKFRGDRAKVRMAEATLSSLEELTSKVDLIMNHLNIEAPGKGEEMTR
mmetsp:Transcript_11079/g.27257  ORF Transcript_11079/g.27257 Transcript_11079/m.27257 type:complete len:158 (-) Transcript_11079:178-651(-)|eukprot:CAMPEP_0181103410 /NCGR_PEP_ID=MMETSP1071-20121207/14850_1 /TAXON_ID=35127 /ORGANISM="Thalassiosira sp., Strain NH16" /LENGTH=157 /DNA_ID=CAMNT_0023186481 /DNA_START=174 /DNA_END=647 /DNA_ORIENTATION=-